MKVLVTGANGFIGRNLCIALEQNQGHEVLRFTRDNNVNELFEILQKADFVFHLAGVNRPIDEEDFQSVNVGLIGIILDTMDKTSRPIPLSFRHQPRRFLKTPMASANAMRSIWLWNGAPETRSRYMCSGSRGFSENGAGQITIRLLRHGAIQSLETSQLPSVILTKLSDWFTSTM